MGASPYGNYVSTRTRLLSSGISVGFAALFLALGGAGCGDDDEEPAATTAEPPATETAPATVTETVPAETVTVPQEVEPPPEEQPGGAGDEEPAQSQADFTGRDGRIRPALIRVAPFIAIRIQLRSADGGDYGLDCRGRRLQVDAEIETASTRLAGRRPGEQVRCDPLGAHNGVAVSASAEPGP
jgi:hypothetical protein